MEIPNDRFAILLHVLCHSSTLCVVRGLTNLTKGRKVHLFEILDDKKC